jgi:hypothetical protein
MSGDSLGNLGGAGSPAAQDIFADALDEADLPAWEPVGRSGITDSPSQSFQKVFFEHPSDTLDKLNLARTLFDLKEYRKCAFSLEPILNVSQAALFLRNYATYLVCEQKSEEMSLENGDKVQACTQGGSPAVTSHSREMLAMESQLKQLRERK